LEDKGVVEQKGVEQRLGINCEPRYKASEMEVHIQTIRHQGFQLLQDHIKEWTCKQEDKGKI
jgi:hypothetical protein